MFNILKRKIFPERLFNDNLRKKYFCELIEKKPKFNILFFGNDEISLPSLDKLNLIKKK